MLKTVQSKQEHKIFKDANSRSTPSGRKFDAWLKGHQDRVELFSKFATGFETQRSKLSCFSCGCF